MKKIFAFIISAALMWTAGCKTASDLVSTPLPSASTVPEVTEEPVVDNNTPLEPETRIAISQTLKMTNEWTIMGDFDYAFTGSKKDRIVLGTSAKTKNGHMDWDDSQYWTLAVISDDGAYNLFFERITGYVYAEVNQAYVRGVATPMITAYIFSGTDREIRNYYFDNGEFVENQVFNTKAFSTGGINNLYSSFPEYTAK